jgi:ATP-dependent RNA helicase DDX5/DBP2
VNGYTGGGGYSNGGGYGGGGYGGGAGGDRMSNLGAGLQKQNWGKLSFLKSRTILG